MLPQLSHEGLVRLVLDEEIARRSPDEAAARFAAAGQLQRLSIAPDRGQLSTKDETYALRSAYVRDNRWLFQAAFIELYSAVACRARSRVWRRERNGNHASRAGARAV